MFMKKVLPWALACAMLLSTAGCASEAPSSSASPATGSSETPSTTSAEPVAMRIMSKDPLLSSVQEPFLRTIREELNIDLTWETVDKNVYDEKVNLGFAGGNGADIVWMSSPARLSEAIENNALIPLDDVKQMEPWNTLPESYWDSCTIDGNIYTLPVVKANAVSISYRSDWAENVGVTTPPTNAEELYDLLYKFTTEDPDGNGKDDTVGFTMMGKFQTTDPLWYMFMDARPTANMGIYYDDAQGQYKSVLLEEENITEAMEWFVRCYQNGVLDKEWIVDSKTTYDEKLISSKTGLFIKEPEYIYARLSKLQKNVPEAELTVIPNFTGKTGEIYRVGDAFASMDVLTSFCKEPEAGKKLMAFLYSDRGTMLKIYGLEGESYTIVDNELQFKNPDDKDQLNEGFVLQNVFGLQPPVVNPVMQQHIADAQTDSIVRDIARYLEYSPKCLQINDDVNKTVLEGLAKIIIGEQPVSYYSTILEEVKAMGLEDALAELNANA